LPDPRHREPAANGNWYDAFALVAEDPALASQRDALLRQAGIKPTVK
jgi:hypothetical protein